MSIRGLFLSKKSSIGFIWCFLFGGHITPWIFVLSRTARGFGPKDSNPAPVLPDRIQNVLGTFEVKLFKKQSIGAFSIH